MKELSPVISFLIYHQKQLRELTQTGNIAINQLREGYLHRLQLLRQEHQVQGMRDGDHDMIRFALIAHVDESLIHLDWSESLVWLQQPLQAIVYQTNLAGDEFFQRLQRILDNNNTPILRVYFLCLGLGFKGKFRLTQTQEYHQLLHDIARRVSFPEESTNLVEQAIQQESSKGYFYLSLAMISLFFLLWLVIKVTWLEKNFIQQLAGL